jgi:hypothetical protein
VVVLAAVVLAAQVLVVPVTVILKVVEAEDMQPLRTAKVTVVHLVEELHTVHQVVKILMVPMGVVLQIIIRYVCFD